MAENGQNSPPSKLWTFGFLAAISLSRIGIGLFQDCLGLNEERNFPFSLLEKKFNPKIVNNWSNTTCFITKCCHGS